MTPPTSPDLIIADRASAAVTDYAHPLGPAARTAHTWIDTLHTPAQIRAECHRRSLRQ